LIKENENVASSLTIRSVFSC